jgi:hypothetical protein
MCVLFEPLADLLVACDPQMPPKREALNTLLAAAHHRGSIARGNAIRFVAPDSSPLGYEERVHALGEVITRADNWHDFFNALVWIRFPQCKVALNALHVREMQARPISGGRGALRDAATQFDESGMIVVSSDARLLELLAQRAWKELFWRRRADVIANMHFLVFGHGLYDALRAPFYRICARAATVLVGRELIAADTVTLCRHVDTIIARRFADGAWYPRPKSLLALPLLGIPGMTEQNESPEYYDDTLQFRPPPDWLTR